MGHNYGPGSPEVPEAMLEVDAAIRMLRFESYVHVAQVNCTWD